MISSQGEMHKGSNQKSWDREDEDERGERDRSQRDRERSIKDGEICTTYISFSSLLHIILPSTFLPI